MSELIRFLESLDQNPVLSSEEAFLEAVRSADLSPEIRRALIERDIGTLNKEVGGRGFMLCLIYQPDNDEQPGRDEPDGDDNVPDQEPEARAA